MSKLPARHGRDHRPARYDTIPGVVVYEYPNNGNGVKSWLYVTAGTSRTGTTPSIQFEAFGSSFDGWIVLNNGTSLLNVQRGQIFGQSDVITFRLAAQGAAAPGDHFAIDVSTGIEVFRVTADGETTINFDNFAGGFFINDSSGNPIFTIPDTGVVFFFDPSGQTITEVGLTDHHVTFVDDANNTTLALDGSGNIAANLQAGKSLTINDSGGNPIFRVDEDGDIHILTGKTVTADL